MIYNSRIAALQFAIIHATLIKANTQLRKEIMDLADVYQKRFFNNGMEVVPSIEYAFNYMVEETGNNETKNLQINKT